MRPVSECRPAEKVAETKANPGGYHNVDFRRWVAYGRGMASVEKVITELKRLRPEQVDEVARIIHNFSQTDCGKAHLYPAVPTRVVDEAVQHGWPAELFTELIGSLPELERFPQPHMENRAKL